MSLVRSIRRRAPVTDAGAGAWPEHVPPLLRRLYAARGALSKRAR
jgi:hypothetical protein